MIGQDLCEDVIKAKLGKTHFINDLYVFEEIDSTSEFLKREMERLDDRTLAVAEVQTAGKGSKGRSWTSESGCGIWMSLLLRTDIPIKNFPAITLVIAHSVARACRNIYGLQVYIKWPNDIVCNGKKICGILSELKDLNQNKFGAVIGIGINVNTRSFPPELENRATSISIETGLSEYCRADLIAEVIRCFSEDYEKFAISQNLSPLLRTYTEMSATIGKQVYIKDLNNEYKGTAISVGNDGCLLVELENGEIRKIFGDEVSVRGIYGYV